VAQALTPYPQYCDALQGYNENHGTSRYNSLQIKLEKHFSGGLYALVSYTLSKTISSGSDNTQRDALTWSGLQGVISPFEASRNEAIAAPIRRTSCRRRSCTNCRSAEEQKYGDAASTTLNALIGGWQVSTIFRYSSGLPMYFRLSGTACNVPAQIPSRLHSRDRQSVSGVRTRQEPLRPGKGAAVQRQRV
jgi:hypothetical protein